jgi:F-type H+-transporting ATPase subunit b
VRQSVDENRARAIVSDFFSTSGAELRGLGDRVEVTSAIPLTSDEQAKVKSATGASAIDFKVDPSILGGLVVRAGDRVVDGSVRSDLTALASQLK